MKVNVSIGDYFSKENPADCIKTLKYSLAKRWQEVEILELAALVGEKRYAMMPGHIIGGISYLNCKEMQLFVLEFPSSVKFCNIKERCDKYEIPITFAYQSYDFAGSEEQFNVVFAYESIIKTPFIINVILNMLYKIFPESNYKSICMNSIFQGGNKLIYLKENACFTFMHLFYPFFDSLNKGGSLQRNLYRFCKKQKILMINNRPAMGPIGLLPSFLAENIDPASIHIEGESKNSAIFIVENKESNYSINHKERTKRLGIEDKCICQLLNDFNGGQVFEDKALLAILTNLLYISGGQKHFLNVMDTFYNCNTSSKWKENISYLKGYLPHNCSENFCPYYCCCENRGTIISTLGMDKKIVKDEEIFYSLEEAADSLKKNLNQAHDSKADGIHLIKAQTAIGKTTAYINLIREYPTEKFLIAVPTNALKKQVLADLVIAGISQKEIFMTLSIYDTPFIDKETLNQISEAHKVGIHDKKNSVLSELYEEIKDDPNKKAVAAEYKNLIDGIKAIDDERIVVTTHSYFLQMPYIFLKKYTTIVDEDILQLQIFNETKSISLNCLNGLKKNNVSGYAVIATEMLNTKENEYRKINSSVTGSFFTEKELCELDYFEKNDNINDLIYAGAFVKIRDRESGEMVVKYFCPRKFYPMKYIILSATLNKEIYKKYFYGSMDVYLYPEKKAAYMGNLKQYTYHSLGRRDLSNKRQVFSYVKKMAHKEDLEIITFKEGKILRDVSGMNSKGLHFGNTTGINALSGKDIGIVGTPFKVEESYKIVACYLGADVNKKIDEFPRVQRVNYKNYNFLIMTYSEPLLREVQLYSLESELEQCIGRARLLRRDCTVYLLSSFPCEQAELQIHDYLLDAETI